jgi:hypothetical protein
LQGFKSLEESAIPITGFYYLGLLQLPQNALQLDAITLSRHRQQTIHCYAQISPFNFFQLGSTLRNLIG